MRYPNLQTAGRELATALAHLRGTPDLLVLGIVRAGVPAAVEVANAVDAPLDLLVRRGLIQVSGIESMQAVSVAGTIVLDPRIEQANGDPGQRAFIAERVEGLRERAALCRGDRAPVSVEGKTILLVDNGVRTGATMRVSINALRPLSPARIIAASPVGNPDARDQLHSLADEVVCLKWPDTSFGHVGMWYADLDVPDEQRIARMLDSRAQVNTASYS